MPTLIVENVPPHIYDHLRRRAAEGQRSIPEETIKLLERVLLSDTAPATRVPDFVAGEEIPAPVDLPWSGRPIPVSTCPGGPRLPDPIDDEP